ncbi:nuclear transport factor 2 family protein [Pedobacter heparinus]|uniref:nuclear transport factor 2 family protein n=1 Tax=Pedobacter heparinus TaxID=984 RepID=UPI00292ED392|nr:nuclear transport factor 2 family protein [Pedobacter heparinus]
MLTTLTAQTRNIVHQFYQALANQELDQLLHLFSEQPDWDVPGNQELAPWLGKRSSRKEIRDFFVLLWQSIEPVSAEIDHVLAEGDFAVVTGEFSSVMLRTGEIYSSIFSAHFTVLDGKIIRYRLQEDSYGLVEALSLPKPV